MTTMNKHIDFILNGEKRGVDLECSQTLLEMLRDKLGIKSPKCGCDRGDCGSCTVMLDGRTVRSCLVLAVEIDGREVKTLEGMMPGGELSALQKSFLVHNSFQCGFCTPGVILSTAELLQKNPHPDRDEIKEAISGNLCRCTGYIPIIEAIVDFANEEK
jgi:carbon-monoxide dehydrogenase small subunit